MAHFGKALDEVRAAEVKELKAKGHEPVLTKSRWLLLKRPEHLTETREARLAELLQYNLRSVRACLLKEEFQFFWGYVFTLLGRPVSGQVVYKDDALEDRTDEESGPDVAQSSAPVAELVPRQGTAFQWCCGGFQHQGKTDRQKILRISDVSCSGNRVISCTWRLAGNRVYP